MPSRVVDWKTITDFVIEAFMKYGVPEEDAKICADVLLESDRRGIESHGVNRFKPIYLDRITSGVQKPVTNLEILKAKEYGMGMVVARNSCHYGIAGYYTSMATKAGCIGMTGTNARPSVAPTWGVEGIFGTNPFTLGVPTDEPFDFNFDCATSITQNGKFEYYERIGHDVIPGTVIGDDGEPVTGGGGAALKRIRQGTAALVTVGGIGEMLGGYKGYGFAMFVEFLSSVLSDGFYGKQLNGVDENGNKCAPRLGHFFIAIDTDHFMGEDICRKKAGDIARLARGSKKMPGAERIWTAGEKEYEIRLARKDGVPVNESVQAELNFVREETGLTGKYAFPWD